MFDGISEVIPAAMRQSWTTEKEKQVWQYLADRTEKFSSDGNPFVYKRKPANVKDKWVKLISAVKVRRCRVRELY